MASINTDGLQSLRDQAAQLLHDVVEQATTRALDETKSARSRGSRLVRGGKTKDTASARDVAFNAASAAIELWQAARERAGDRVGSIQSTVAESSPDLRAVAQGLRSEAADAARSASASLGDSVSSVTHAVGDSVNSVTSAVGESVQSVTHAVGDSAQRAADGSRSVAVASARAGKNSLSLMFWTGAAGAIAYYAFLDEERRTQVRDMAMRAIDEGRAILADLRGEDGEFT